MALTPVQMQEFSRIAAIPPIQSVGDLVVRTPTLERQVADLYVVRTVAEHLRTPTGIAYAQRLDSMDGTGTWVALFNQLDQTGRMPNGISAAATYQRAMDLGFDSLREVQAIVHRKRPYILDDTITTIVNRPDMDSFPSGHTLESYIGAGVAGTLVPEYSSLTHALANEMAVSRTYAGVHHPSDTIASAMIANAAAPKALADVGLLSNPVPLPATHDLASFVRLGENDALTAVKKLLDHGVIDARTGAWFVSAA